MTAVKKKHWLRYRSNTLHTSVDAYGRQDSSSSRKEQWYHSHNSKIQPRRCASPSSQQISSSSSLNHNTRMSSHEVDEPLLASSNSDYEQLDSSSTATTLNPSPSASASSLSPSSVPFHAFDIEHGNAHEETKYNGSFASSAPLPGSESFSSSSSFSQSSSSSSSKKKPPTVGKRRERFGIGGSAAPDAVPRIKRANMMRLLSLARPQMKTIAWATLCLFVSQVLNLALPAIVAVIIDAISTPPESDPNNPTVVKHDGFYRLLLKMGFGSSPRDLLNAATVLLLILITLGNIFGMIRGYLFTLSGERIVASMRRNLFFKIMQFEIGFFDTTRTGELINRLASDSTIVKDAATTNISMGLRWVATIIVGIAYLFVISWKLTLVMLSVIPLCAVGAVYYGRKLKELSRQTQDALADATTTAEESISSIRTIRSFGREENTAKQYSEKIEVTFGLGKTIAWQYGVFLGLLGFIGGLAVVIVLYYGAVLVLNGELTTGTLTSFVLYTITVGTALAALTGLFASFASALGAAERIFELMDRLPTLGVDPAFPPQYTGANNQGKIPSPFRGEVKLTDVHFSYPSRPQNQILKGLNLHLKPGTVTALVGPSGQGKTTVVSLISRFYDIESRPSSSITIDGIDIREMNLNWLHRHVAMISQEPILFAMSIRENLIFGMENLEGDGSDDDHTSHVSDTRLREVCEQANAWEFIREFKEGFDTQIGERGVRLSTGQRQRLAIARCLLMNPTILVADEATSALDSESEYLVQQALERLMANRTTLVIAHRLSTVQNADVVCVVTNGGILEQGRHAELLAKGGLYAKLVQRQLTQPQEVLQLHAASSHSHSNATNGRESMRSA